MKKTRMLKAVLFLIIFGGIFAVVNKIIVFHGDDRGYQIITGFYNEKKNSIDAVYIGGSKVITSWQAPIAWHAAGITVHSFASSSQPLVAVPYLVKEVRKTQPDALQIICINSTSGSASDVEIHFLTDDMPTSINRFQLVNAFCDVRGNSFEERMEFYFPFIRYHSRWNKLSKKDLHRKYNGLKGGISPTRFLTSTEDITSNFIDTTKRGTLSESLQIALKELLDYCDAERVRVLFVIVPGASYDLSRWARINTISDYVQSRGYPCLNMLDYIEEIGLDFTTDYYDKGHPNVHGALKTIKFLTEYLVKNYGFKDKRGEAAYSDWDAAYSGYMKIIAPYVLDIETNYEKRDYSLPAPKLNAVQVFGTSLTVSWGASEGANGYRIYRKEGKSSWQVAGEVGGEALRFTDKSCKKDTSYTYTVVPWHMTDGEKAWGRFDIKGVEAKSLLDAPQLTSVEKTDDGVKISWEKVEDADGYKVFRRLPGKNWTSLRDVGNTDSFVDTAVLENLPFCYTVRAYSIDRAKKKIDGSQDPEGLLYLPELTMPAVKISVNDGVVTLSWEPAEGMNGYRIYRNGELIAELPAWIKKFTDQEGAVTDQYRVEAYFTVGSEEYRFNLN